MSRIRITPLDEQGRPAGDTAETEVTAIERISEFVAAYESWHYDEYGQLEPQDILMSATTSSGDTFELRLSDLRSASRLVIHLTGGEA